jgi:ABC-type phosphate/phosphonate transport system substrate-binding protein
MIASLPMYQPAGGAVQAFWTKFAALLQVTAGSSIPAALTLPDDLLTHWRSPELLLSQTCGYPLSTLLRGQVRLVGAFAYAVPGARGIACRSQLVCRASDSRNSLVDFAGSCVAYNARDSQSGYNALRAMVAGISTLRPFFKQAKESGAHVKSLEMVRTGQADIAAIDAVTWALFQTDNPAIASELRVCGQTESYPGLPLITALDTPTELLASLRSCLDTIVTDPEYSPWCNPLRICGFEAASLDDYAICTVMEAQAMSLGMPTL